MQKKHTCSLFAISLLFLTSCATMPKPPDVPACENMKERLYQDPATGHQMFAPSPTCMAQIGESSCGHCVYIVSGKEAFFGELPAHQLNKKPWSTINLTTVQLPAEESYAPLASYIIDACKKMDCNSQVDAFKVKLDSLNGLKPAAQNPK